MKGRFSSYLLMGKVAALPAVMACAETSTAVASSTKSGEQLTLATMASPDVALNKTAYGESATVCLKHGSMPALSVVVTGVHAQDAVYILAAMNGDVLASLTHAKNLRAGADGIVVLDTAENKSASHVGDAAAGSKSATLKYDVDLMKLASAGLRMSEKGEFQIQAAVVPDSAASLGGAAFWQSVRFSPRVTVTVDNANSPYSTCAKS